LHPAMRQNVLFAGYTVPTPIQQYVLPAIFKGHDVIACAQTGLYIGRSGLIIC
jgi:superfamily II DNA/RNA helicase